MHGIICGYKLDRCDCVILACETNERVGNQRGMVLVWDEALYTHELGITSGMDSTYDMNEDWLQRLVWNYKHDEYSFIVCLWLVCGQCI